MFTNNIIKTPRDVLYPHFKHYSSINIDRIHEAQGKGGDNRCNHNVYVEYTPSIKNDRTTKLSVI